MNLLELKDSRLCLRNQQAVLAHSPGYANITGRIPVFGTAAQQMARLHPRDTFNQFWHQCSLDPLLIKTKHFRHHADLAYGHLKHLLEGVNVSAPVLVAAASTSTRPQLAVLLGVLKQSGLPVQGLVDHGLLLAAASGSSDCIVLDLQLHQAVLTAFAIQDGVLAKLKVVQVPGAGLLGLQDAWTSVIGDAFQSQSRFNPTHSAETEQYIANQLDTWLTACAADGELLLEINLKGTSYQARVRHEQFVERTRAMYARIARELPALTTPTSTLHVHASSLALPGLIAAFPGVSGIRDDGAMAVALQHADRLLQTGNTVAFISRLALGTTATSAVVVLRQPTHLLYRHQAVALPVGRLIVGNTAAGMPAERMLTAPDLAGTVALQRTLRGITVESHGTAPVLLNGKPLAQGQLLVLGDRLDVEGHDAPLQLIAVE